MGELTHGEVQDLLGVFALDAVDDDEREAIERHLGSCLLCQKEVAEHREVAAMMASGFQPAPEGVWDRIAGALEETPPAMRPVTNLAAARERRRGGGLNPLRVVAAVATVAVAAMMGGLVVKTIDTSDRVAGVETALRGDDRDVARAADAAARRVDARPVSLRSGDGRFTADAVLLPDGTGYIVETNLPPLGADRSYQLWAVVRGTPISVGVLGPVAGPKAFHTSSSVSALAITEEVAGGVVRSEKQPTVVGTVA